MSKHTKTPYHVEGTTIYAGSCPIAECDTTGYSLTIEEENLANATFIVRACNAHDKLVEALKEAETAITFISHDPNSTPGLLKIRAALKLAKEDKK